VLKDFGVDAGEKLGCEMFEVEIGPLDCLLLLRMMKKVKRWTEEDLKCPPFKVCESNHCWPGLVFWVGSR